MKLSQICRYDMSFLCVFVHFRGTEYVELPYTVKGMDVSFSGVLSYIEVSQWKLCSIFHGANISYVCLFFTLDDKDC